MEWSSLVPCKQFLQFIFSGEFFLQFLPKGDLDPSFTQGENAFLCRTYFAISDQLSGPAWCCISELIKAWFASLYLIKEIGKLKRKNGCYQGPVKNLLMVSSCNNLHLNTPFIAKEFPTSTSLHSSLHGCKDGGYDTAILNAILKWKSETLIWRF